jgi:anti-anti-sigma factor
VDVDITLDMPRHVAVVHVRGALDSVTSPALSGSIAALIGDGGYDVVVDLTEASAMLAGGVRALRRGIAFASAQDRTLRLCCPRSSAIRPALAVAGLDRELRVYEESSEAVLAGA